MASSKPYRISSITEIHRLMGLPKPHHPLISIVDLKGLRNDTGIEAVVFDLYVISMKTGCDGLHYGQQKYDFDEGLMAFLSPGQILRGEENGVPVDLDGWMLFVHPDFLWNTSLATKIKRYEYFSYATSEALFLSDKEEIVINDLIKDQTKPIRFPAVLQLKCPSNLRIGLYEYLTGFELFCLAYLIFYHMINGCPAMCTIFK